MRRILFRTAITVGITIVLAYGALVWHNNRNVSYPTEGEMQTSLTRGIAWLASNRNRILLDGNPVLWWMLLESAQLTGNDKLGGLLLDYEKRYLERNRRNPWTALFRPDERVRLAGMNFSHFPDYNLVYVYAANCDPDLAFWPEIHEQLDADFCWNKHPVSPACATHQLIGIRLLQRYQCGDQSRLPETGRALQDRIVSQLTWDPRAVDVYLQRLWTLAESGVSDRIKPVWIRRALNAQRPDGGWGNFQPLIPMGGDRHFGFSSRLFGVSVVETSFHATAQGVYLMALLLHGPEQSVGADAGR